jgi:SAM-dependent methyltransferase
VIEPEHPKRPSQSGLLSSANGWSDRLRRAVVRRAPRAVLDRARAVLGRPQARIVTLKDLDAELARAAALFAVSEEAARNYLKGFAIASPPNRPVDPFSPSYRRWVFDLYAEVSGHQSYAVANEASSFDVDTAVAVPYPYATGSSKIVGEELIARGLIFTSLGLDPPARIIEFGSGWGNVTLDLAALGFEVTAVEIEPRFCSLTQMRNRSPQNLTTVESGMLEFEAEEPFDVALFYESFHHCADHLEMLEHLRALVRPGGKVLWAAEPIGPMDYPWGLRLDGYSLWSTRTYGWLELGFDETYFAEALARTGWQARRFRLPRGSPLADVIVATR